MPASGSASPLSRTVDSAAGERRELGGRWRLRLAQHRVALGRRLWVELAEDLPQLHGQADHRLVLGLALGVDAVEEPFARHAAQHEVELPREVRGVTQTRAQPLAQERRGQVGGVTDQQHVPLAHLVGQHGAELVHRAAGQRTVLGPVPRLEQRPHPVRILEIRGLLVRAAA